jgi:anaerobic selenocysteine-containing dehydrogenase
MDWTESTRRTFLKQFGAAGAVALVVGAAARRVWKALHGEPVPPESFAAVDPLNPPTKMGCC